MYYFKSFISSYALALLFIPHVQAATTILYSQNFETPAAFVNNGGDVNIFNSVNSLYGNQPTGFEFSQTFTVETLLVNGDQAFGTGYSDPSGKGGNYTLGMLSSGQDDKLGLSFDIGTNNFLNMQLDISSIDLSVFGGPFVTSGTEPVFNFTLFDNPSGLSGVGSGDILSSFQATASASDQTVFNWTEVLFGLDARGNTNGNVILQIDLLSGGYAALDNFIIAASDKSAVVPIPSAIWLFSSGLLALIGFRNKRN